MAVRTVTDISLLEDPTLLQLPGGGLFKPPTLDELIRICPDLPELHRYNVPIECIYNQPIRNEGTEGIFWALKLDLGTSIVCIVTSVQSQNRYKLTSFTVPEECVIRNNGKVDDASLLEMIRAKLRLLGFES